MNGWFLFLPLLSFSYSILVKADIDKSHPSSMVSQVIHIQVPEIKQNKNIQISMRPVVNKDIVFFVDQFAGQKMVYREELFHRVEKFYIDTNQIKKSEDLKVSFKVVSDFKENDELLIHIYYTLSIEIKALFFISIFSQIILTKRHFSTTLLFSLSLAIFCQLYNLYDISVYLSVLTYYILNTTRVDVPKFCVFSLIYFAGSIYSLNGVIAFIFLNIMTVTDNHSQTLTQYYLLDIFRFLIPEQYEYSLLILKLFLVAIFVYTNTVHKQPEQRGKSITAIVFIGYLIHLLILLIRSFSDNEIRAYVSMEPYIMRTPFINYTSSWLKDLQPKLALVPDFSECEFCNFTGTIGKYKPNSDYNDTVVVTGFGKRDSEIEFFVRTLRSTGSKARIVMFTSQDEHSPRLAEILKKCQVVVVDIPDFKNFHFLLKRKTRFPLIFDMLNTYPEYFDRIMYNDLFDTFFQGDPFTEEISKDTVTAGTEKGNMFNRWVYVRARKLAGWKWTKHRYEASINSGFFVGSAAHMKAICELEIAVYGPNFKVRSSDQVILNYLYYTGQFRYLGIEWNLSSSPVSHYPSIAADVTGYDNPALGRIIHRKTGTRPLLIHQYNRNWKYTRILHDYCPGSKYEFTLKL